MFGKCTIIAMIMIATKLYRNTNNGVNLFFQDNVGQYYVGGHIGPIVQGRKRVREFQMEGT